MRRELIYVVSIPIVIATLAMVHLATNHTSSSMNDATMGSPPPDSPPSSVDGLSWAPRRLTNRKFDAAAQPPEARPDRIAFLPTINRSDRKIHETFLRSIEGALAAEAALFDGRSVAAPSLVDALVRTTGPIDWFSGGSSVQYSKNLIDQLHRATGAGVAVWAEITEPNRVVLHSLGLMPGADASRWQGVTLEGHGDIDRFLYDAPAALLARIRERKSSPRAGMGGSAMPPSAASFERLARAQGLLSSGDPASFALAERELARLITVHPTWPEPLIELAFLRVARPLMFELHPYHALMNEGASPARHLVKLVPNLTEDQRARLAFVDYLYVGHRNSSAEMATMIDALPRSSMERSLLALFHPTRDSSRFGLGHEAEATGLGRTLRDLAAQPGPGARNAHAAARVASGDPVAFESPVLFLRAMKFHADNRDLLRERATWRIASTHAMAQAITVLREDCLSSSIEPDPDASCRHALDALAREYHGPEAFDATALWDENGRRATISAIAVQAASGRAPHAPLHPIPAAVIDSGVSTLSGDWYAIHRLLQLANEAIARERTIAVEGEGSSVLLISPMRSRIARSIDWMAAAAYQPGLEAISRGRNPDAAAALDPLRALGSQYELDGTFAIRHRIDRSLKREIPHELAINSLASRHPYHPDYFRDYVRSTTSRTWKGMAPWLAAVIPYPPLLENFVWTLRFDTGERDATIAALLPEVARRPDVGFAMTLDTALRSPPNPDPASALAVLEAATAEFPHDDRLFEQSAWIALEAGRFDLAERKLRDLLERRGTLKPACFGLAQVARRREALATAEKILLECGSRATKDWDRHELLLRAATLQRDDGRYVESLETIDAAAVGIGPSRAVLEHRAASLALAGQSELAAKTWMKSRSAYPSSGWESAVQLADFELGRGDLERAAAILSELIEEGRLDEPKVLVLARSIHTARGDLSGFETLCRRGGARGFEALARFSWEMRRDPVTGLATLNEASGMGLNQAAATLLRAEILLANGDAEAALAEVRGVPALEQNADSRRIEFEGRLAQEGIIAVERWVASLLAHDRWSISTWETKARLEIAKGDFAQARSTLAWSTRALRQPGIGGPWAWWRSVRPLLLLETSISEQQPDRDHDLRLESLLAASVQRLPNDLDLWQALVRVRESLGQHDRALAAQRQLARVWPGHPSLADAEATPAAMESPDAI